VSVFENAVHQWRRGERRLSQAPAERAPLLARVTDALVAELRRRLGGRFSAEELAELYSRDTAWCLQLAMDIAPGEPWAWDSSVVVDAAFARYLREAADYAGGRRILARK
jgi:DNA-binding transcriptional regulator YdaS (Cro superfamily)